MVRHYEFQLNSKSRGFHLITREVLEQIPVLPQSGMFFLYIKHTSAALTINEDADPSVRVDFEGIMNHIVPENLNFLTHTTEGPDDMPAHVKAALIGSSIVVPIIGGQLALGTWQGIYLCEFRNFGGKRKLIASIWE